MQFVPDRLGVVIGIDPGLASTGFVMIENNPTLRKVPRYMLAAGVKILHSGLLRTKPAKGKVKKSFDRAKRISEMLKCFVHLRSACCADDVVWAAETYTLRPGLPTTNAGVQTLAVFGGVIGVAVSHGDLFVPVHPAEAKAVSRAVKGVGARSLYSRRQSDIEAAMLDAYKWPPSQAAHVGDALGVAVAALSFILEVY